MNEIVLLVGFNLDFNYLVPCFYGDNTCETKKKNRDALTKMGL